MIFYQNDSAKAILTCTFQMCHVLIYNKMNPGYFPLAATALKPQQIAMFLHISARVWGRRGSPHTSEQEGSMLKPQYLTN